MDLPGYNSREDCPITLTQTVRLTALPANFWLQLAAISLTQHSTSRLNMVNSVSKQNNTTDARTLMLTPFLLLWLEGREGQVQLPLFTTQFEALVSTSCRVHVFPASAVSVEVVSHRFSHLNIGPSRENKVRPGCLGSCACAAALVKHVPIHV